MPPKDQKKKEYTEYLDNQIMSLMKHAIMKSIELDLDLDDIHPINLDAMKRLLYATEQSYIPPTPKLSNNNQTNV